MYGRAHWHSFGRGEHGELGRMVITEGVDAPGVQNADVRPLALPQKADVESELRYLYCGHFHCLARCADGRVLAWGANGEGQLGITGPLSDDAFVNAPSDALVTLIEELRKDNADKGINSCAGGRSHSLFVSSCGRCFVTGRLPTSEPGRQDTMTSQTEELREIELMDGSGNQPNGRVVSCYAGESHSLFCTDAGEVWSWLGENVRVVRAGLERPTARAVLGLPKVVQISCGWHHTLALTEHRQVYSFGVGCFGQLGLGSCRNCPSPSHVALPEECDVVNVAAGFASSFAVTTQGWVYAWGANERCQLGLGSAVRGTATPKPVDALARVKVVQVAAGFAHSACITHSGLLYLWGSGSYGQLGFGYDDTKFSLCLDGGGCAAFAAGSAGSTVAVNGLTTVGAPGSSTVGHTRHWMQVWPRRCVRGPFLRNKCFEIKCGAYHTFARAATDGASPLDPSTLAEPEVLQPTPILAGDVRAPFTSRAVEANVDSVEGKHGAPSMPEASAASQVGARRVDHPASVLRTGVDKQLRNAETFRMLSGLFWETSPLKCLAPVPPPTPARSSPLATEAGWRRALVQTAPPCKLVVGDWSGHSFKSPLTLKQVHDKTPRKLESSIELLRLPVDGGGVHGPTTWDAVDEAIHRAFCRGLSATKPDLAALLKDASSKGAAGFSPELPNGEMRRGLPPAPCRGLARIECLTPRPFYVQHGQGKVEKQAPARGKRSSGPVHARYRNNSSASRLGDPLDGCPEEEVGNQDDAEDGSKMPGTRTDSGGSATDDVDHQAEIGKAVSDGIRDNDAQVREEQQEDKQPALRPQEQEVGPAVHGKGSNPFDPDFDEATQRLQQQGPLLDDQRLNPLQPVSDEPVQAQQRQESSLHEQRRNPFAQDLDEEPIHLGHPFDRSTRDESESSFDPEPREAPPSQPS